MGDMESKRETIVIAGATGFVGSVLRDRLRDRYQLRCLTRSGERARAGNAEGPDQWQQCDLFSLLELEESLKGADRAIYLVHSMLPSARLVQGTFADLDLILADNFARAAQSCGLKEILYLGGLIPEMASLSPHLASRLEVEQTLGSGHTPVTALRAGLIVGRGGSSLRIVVNLVKRLPVMLLPEWTRTRTQPIAIKDILRAFDLCLEDPPAENRHFDIGGPDIMTYREMLERTAQAMGLRRRFFNIPLFSARLSKLWVSMLGGASRYLVGPLVDSLRHPMVAKPNALQAKIVPEAVGFETALRDALGVNRRSAPNPRDSLRQVEKRSIRSARRVRSVQRMVLPPSETAETIAPAYFPWLQSFLRPLIRSSQPDSSTWRLSLFMRGLCLIEFRHSDERSTPDRQLYYISKGLLARTAGNSKGRIEFREMLDRHCLIIAIHDFTPMLPWFLYSRSQAPFHLFVIRRFGRALERMSEPKKEPRNNVQGP